jgi:hypothetical protein
LVKLKRLMRYAKREKTIKKFTKEELLQSIDFSRSLQEDESIEGVTITAYDADSKEDLTEVAIDGELSSYDDKRVSFFLTSNLAEGVFIIQVLIETDAGQKLISEIKLIVREFFIA